MKGMHMPRLATILEAADRTRTRIALLSSRPLLYAEAIAEEQRLLSKILRAQQRAGGGR